MIIKAMTSDRAFVDGTLCPLLSVFSGSPCRIVFASSTGMYYGTSFPVAWYIDVRRMLQIDMDEFISVTGMMCDSTITIQQVDGRVLMRYRASGLTCHGA